jgi:O-antigen/teichoic acid export membrane protein
VALVAILSFNELGVSLAIVRWRDEPPAIAPTVATISLVSSVVLTAAAWFAAPSFTAAMGDPGATEVVRVLSLCVLVNGLVATPAALLQRTFRQDQRLVADQVNVWVGAVVSVGLALLGAGAMALAVGRLAGAGISALVFWHYSPLPMRFGIDRRYVRPLLAFGLPLAGASIIVFLVGFVDQLAVGRVLGPVQLGFYVLAVNLASWPLTILSQPLRSVAPAMFARLQDDPERMHRDFQSVLRPLCVVALPMCVVLAVTAPDVVALVYGSAWAPAAAPLRWLAIAAAARIFFELAYDYLVVLGRSRQILVLQAVWVCVLTPTVVLAVREWGIAGAGAALVAVAVVVSLPLYVHDLGRAGISARLMVVAAGPGVAGGVAVGLLASALGWLVGSALLTVLLAGLVLTAVTGALLWRNRATLEVFRSAAPTPVATEVPA